MSRDPVASRADVLTRMAGLRQYQRGGHRAPHKPLLTLLALGRLATTGSSALPWAQARTELVDLIAEYGPGWDSRGAQSAAYPFTRLRSDGIWTLDQDVPMDQVRPLDSQHVVGRFSPPAERALAAEPGLLYAAARTLVERHFPATVAPDILTAVGLDADTVLFGGTSVGPGGPPGRRRDPAWPQRIIQAFDRRCAFCGYDGAMRTTTVAFEAAHVRWFAFDGPDSMDNGLALCVLHHKLFDRGVLGLDDSHRVQVSAWYSARTDAGQAVYQLHGRRLTVRPGTVLPAGRQPHRLAPTRSVQGRTAGRVTHRAGRTVTANSVHTARLLRRPATGHTRRVR